MSACGAGAAGGGAIPAAAALPSDHCPPSPFPGRCLIAGAALGCACIYTDHSLFGFADGASIHINQYLKLTLSAVDACICVSHTQRENLVLRAALDPRRVYAIPNAVDGGAFAPDPAARPASRQINIVMLSRLVFRKGVDLAVAVIPIICARFPEAHFIVGGDGPKRLALEEMRERHALHDRVELLGAVPHRNVRDVLVRGHIFLNCSLTEAFCIAILEAACCGCFVVSTRVGGVPEVLPPHAIAYAEPRADALAAALAHAIPRARYLDGRALHAELRDAYNWPEVAQRTLRVYEAALAAPRPPLVERLRRYCGVGRVFGPIAVIAVSLIHLMTAALDWLAPAHTADVAPPLPFAAAADVEPADALAEDYDALARPPPPPTPADAAADDAARKAAARRGAWVDYTLRGCAPTHTIHGEVSR